MEQTKYSVTEVRKVAEIIGPFERKKETWEAMKPMGKIYIMI